MVFGCANGEIVLVRPQLQHKSVLDAGITLNRVVVAAHKSGVTCLTALPTAIETAINGSGGNVHRPLVATGSSDGSIKVWNLFADSEHERLVQVCNLPNSKRGPHRF